MAPIEVFTSYSHKDETPHDELAKHLKLLERQSIIQPWHDRRITAGKEVNVEIDVVLNRAGIILLLVSPDFVASDYCWGKEMKRAMERHKAGEARVIPVILRPVDWHATPFGELLALPTDGKAVTSWTNQDDALLDVAKGIRAVASDFAGTIRNGPPLTLELRGAAYTTQYHGAVIEVDIGNKSSSPHQITRCSLEVTSVGATIEHAPGPSNLIGRAPWLPNVPFQLDPRKLTRGRLFFSAGMGRLREGPPQEPLLAKLRLEFFSEDAIEQDVEIYTFDALRRKYEG